MLIRRCAWHRTYRGYPLALGIASWRGWRPAFTDGMCAGCASRFRQQWDLPDPAPRPLTPATPGMGLLRVGATLALIAGFILEARLLDDVRGPAVRVTPPVSVQAVAEPTVEPSPAPSVRRPARIVASRRPVSRPPVRVVATSEGADVAIALEDPLVENPPLWVAAATEPELDLASPPPLPPERPRILSLPNAFAALPHAGMTAQTP